MLDGSVGDLSIIISYFKCQTTKIKPPFAAEGDGDKIAEFPPGIMIGASVSAIFLLTILFCIFKKQKARRKRAADVTRDDENPVYGIYFDSDPRMEVEDNNDYYSSDYETAEETSRATDNNPLYE